mgnify:CR=1 FL=1|jgi:hypothetical protein
MGLFDKVKKTTIESRRYEEKLYEVALEEVEAGEVRKGLYAKALAKSDGDKEKADGIYLKLRVQSIMDDIESEQINHRENERVYKAFQELTSDEIVKEKSLEDECKDVLDGKGFILHKPIFGKYEVRAKGKPRSNIYSSQDLEDIKKWADTLVI